MSVIDLTAAREERQPHLGGEAVCIGCRETWEAVAPVGTWQLECPACGLWKGVFRWPIGAAPEDSLFVCNCGCEALSAFFHHGLFRMRCMKCGIDHTSAIFGE